jgi:hypothetical protein
MSRTQMVLHSRAFGEIALDRGCLLHMDNEGHVKLFGWIDQSIGFAGHVV